MSPLVNTPNQGYPDYQRQANFDTLALYNVSGQVVNPFVDTGVMPLGRFAYVAGEISPGGGPIMATFVWYADAGLTTVTGRRRIVTDPHIANGLQFRLPNLGSYLTIDFADITGVSPTMNTRIVGSNRVHPLELIPLNAVLIDQQGSALVAGNTTYYPTDYYAGPAQVWADPQVGGASLSLQYMNTLGVWDTTLLLQGLAVNPNYIATWVLPLGAWRIIVGNTGALSTISLAVTPSTTGAT